MVRWGRVLAGAVAYVAALAGVADTVVARPVVPEPGLRPFRDCADFTGAVRELAAREAERVVRDPYAAGEQLSGLGLGPGHAADLPTSHPESPAAAVPAAVTGTNVQERDVDEPDVVKVDRTRLVALDDGPARPALTVLDVAGDVPRRLGRVEVGRGARELLLLPHARALVLGTRTARWPGLSLHQEVPRAVLTLVDLADPAHPAVLRTQEITGTYVTARLADGIVHVVVSSAPRIVRPRPGPPEAWRLATVTAREAARAAPTRALLPARVVRDAAGGLVAAGALLDCTAVLAPHDPDGPAITSVIAVDGRGNLAAFGSSPAAGVLGTPGTVYAAPGRLYLARTERQPGRGPATRIHALDTRGTPRYVGSGTVRGTLLDRWALSARDGLLRVASTRGRGGALVTVLAEQPGRLVPVGRVGGLGPRQQIKSVRWFGDLAAIVTFRQVDPLHLVDLTDPRHPRAVGELRVPGYSGYLHPVGRHRLLGIGPDGRMRDAPGLQASVFGIADPAAPRRLGTLGLGPASAAVEADERAFTYLPGRSLAVLPVVRTDRFGLQPAEGAHVAVAVRIDGRGRPRPGGRFAPGATLLRVVPVGDRLVALTTTAAVLLDPDGLRPLGSVRLTPLNTD